MAATKQQSTLETGAKGRGIAHDYRRGQGRRSA